MKFLLLFCVLLSALNCVVSHDCLNLIYEWKDLDYQFPSEAIKSDAITQGLYVPGNGVPLDIDVFYKKNGQFTAFTTIPRFTTGIPFSLAKISKEKGPNGPILEPYPDYESHSSHGKNCEGITSVFRVKIDPCKQMWVLDTGRIGTTQHCSPQIIVFDLETDTVIHRYVFPDGQFKPGESLFITPVVDILDPPPTGTCSKAKVYIADVTGYGLVVYDIKLEDSWRVENKLFEYTPQYANFTVAGESFTLTDGVFGMAVTPLNFGAQSESNKYTQKPQKSAPRKLFFHSLAGIKENSVNLDVLNNPMLWKTNPRSKPKAFTTVGSRETQSATEAMDSKGNLFFTLMDPIGIASWNINTPYDQYTVRVVNDETLQFGSGMKVIRNNKNKEELWILTCRFQKVMAGTMDRINEINFRVQKSSIKDLLT